MWLISLRDLEWRRRRFAIAVVATGLVFGITLLLAGINSSFGNEIDRTVAGFHADSWIVPKTTEGSFTTSAAFPSSVASDVARIAGVREADPMVVTRVTVPESSTEGSGGVRHGHSRDRSARHRGTRRRPIGRDRGRHEAREGHRPDRGVRDARSGLSGPPTAAPSSRASPRRSFRSGTRARSRLRVSRSPRRS